MDLWLFLRPIPRLANRLEYWDDYLHVLICDDADAKVRFEIQAELSDRIWRHVVEGDCFRIDSWAYPCGGDVPRIVGSDDVWVLRMVLHAHLCFQRGVCFPGIATIPKGLSLRSASDERIVFESGAEVYEFQASNGVFQSI